MEVRISFEIGDEDGITILRASRRETIIGSRVASETGEMLGVSADQMELARAALIRLGEETLQGAAESAGQLTELLRAAGVEQS